MKLLLSFLLPAVLSLGSSVLSWVLLLQMESVSLSGGSQHLLFVFSVLRCPVVVTWCQAVVTGWLYFHVLSWALSKLLPSGSLSHSVLVPSMLSRCIGPSCVFPQCQLCLLIKQDLHNCNRFGTPNSVTFHYAFDLASYTLHRTRYDTKSHNRQDTTRVRN